MSMMMIIYGQNIEKFTTIFANGCEDRLRASLTSTHMHTPDVLNVHIFGSFTIANSKKGHERGKERESTCAHNRTDAHTFYVWLLLCLNSLLWHFKCTRHNMTCLCGVMFSFAAVVHILFCVSFGHDRACVRVHCARAQMATAITSPHWTW